MRKNIHPHIDTKMVMGGRSIWGPRCRWLTFHCHVCMHDGGLKEVGKCCPLYHVRYMYFFFVSLAPGYWLNGWPRLSRDDACLETVTGLWRLACEMRV